MSADLQDKKPKPVRITVTYCCYKDGDFVESHDTPEAAVQHCYQEGGMVVTHVEVEDV